MSSDPSSGIQALLDEARGLRDDGNATAAVDRYREALARIGAAPASAPRLLVEGLRGFAGALLDTDLPHESACVPAEDALRRALTVEREQNGDSLTAASILLDLAEFIHDHDRCEDSASLGREAWDIAMRAGADGTEMLLEATDWLAWWCEAHEDWDWAEELLVRSLGILRQLLGASHPRLAAIAASLANAYAHRGRLDEADDLAARAYDSLVVSFGELPEASRFAPEDAASVTPARLAMSVLLSVRASVAAQRGEMAGARYLWRKALLLLDTADAGETADVADNLASNRAQILGSLAEVASTEGDFDEAERLFQHALTDSAEAPDLRAELLQRYATWLEDRQRPLEARRAREEAQRLLESDS